MTNLRRLKNDITTRDKRETVDRAKSENRDKNDALTQERRFEADRTMNKNRTRNDEITANRREMKDEEKTKETLAIFLLILVVLAISSYFIFF